LARRHIEELATQHRRVIIAGGSGLHFRAVVDPMTFAPTDPDLRRELAARSPDSLVAELAATDSDARLHVDLANQRRVIRALEIVRLTGRTPSQRASSFEAGQIRRYESLYAFRAIGIDAGEISRQRVETRLNHMVDAGFLDEVARLRATLGTSAANAVGYRELARVVGGEVDLEDAITDTLRATNALVKRQRTFFRRDPRIDWLAWHDDAEGRIELAVNWIEEKMQWTS
jgi:tRNA dimethylallyltransferase